MRATKSAMWQDEPRAVLLGPPRSIPGAISAGFLLWSRSPYFEYGLGGSSSDQSIIGDIVQR